MSTIELRRQVKRTVDRLSKRRLRAAADFLRYLQTLEEEDATEELIRIPGALEEHRRGGRDVSQGKGVDWREVRADV